MSSKNRLDFLVTYGDKPVKASGEQVYLQSDGLKPTNQQLLNVEGGELVVWDPTGNDGSGITLAPGGIASADFVRFSVGIDTNGDGMANYLQDIGGDGVDFRKGLVKSNVVEPNCDQPQINDIFFSCTQAETWYSFQVRLDDYYVRSRFPGQNTFPKYIFGAQTELPACDTCDTPHDCQALAQKLVDDINNKYNGDPRKITYFRTQELVEHYQPFEAVVLKPNGFNFCLTYKAADCEGNCAQFDAVTGINIDGAGVVEFDFTTLPSDNTTTAEGHLSRLITQINEALGDTGHAVLVEPTKNCCDKQIQIITSATTVVLDNNGTPVPDCGTFSPFAGREETCGIRIINHPVALDYKEFPDLPPNEAVPNTFYRKIQISPVGPGFAVDGFDVVEVQKSVSPEGLGYFWQQKEYKEQSPGGDFMRNYRQSKRHVGRIGLPDKFSKVRAGQVNRFENYRVWSITHQSGGLHSDWGGIPHMSNHLARLLIPESDTTTHTSVQTYIDAIKTASGLTDLNA